MATGGNKEKCARTVFWRIENISFWDREKRCIVSPTFSARTPQNILSESKLRLHLGLNKADGCVYINLFNNNDDGSGYFKTPIVIDCEFSFMGRNGSPLVSETVQNHDIISSGPIYLDTFVSFQEMFETRRADFLPHDTLTVRCRIWMSDGSVPLSNDEFISLRTRYEGDVKSSFLWPISNFSSLKLNEKVSTIEELKFFNGSSEFQLKFSLQGESLIDAKANLELPAISLHDELIVALKVSVLDNEQKAINCVEEKHKYSSHSEILKNTLNISDILSRKELLLKKSECLRDDFLTLFLEFSGKLMKPFDSIERVYCVPSNLTKAPFKCISSSSDTSSRTAELSRDFPGTSLQVGNSLAILGEDLLTFYKDQSMTDFELHSGDISFPVHKIVLSARSPVFRTMVSSNMEESGSKSLNVPDLDSNTLNRLLIFLYGGTVDPLEWENALQLYYVANKFQVHSLKMECCSFFRSNISVKNVCDIVTLAYRHQDLDMKSLAHSFILSRFDETVSSPEWVKFLESEAELAGMTMHQVYMEKLKARKG